MYWALEVMLLGVLSRKVQIITLGFEPWDLMNLLNKPIPVSYHLALLSLKETLLTWANNLAKPHPQRWDG
jgi:hypothetical protein